MSNRQTLPPGWMWATGDELFRFVTSGSRGWAQYYSDEGALFLRMGNLDHNTISLDLSACQYVRPPQNTEGSRTLVRHNDILISITADLGMVALVPGGLGEAYINQHLALARPAIGDSAKYLAWFLASERHGNRQLNELRRGATKVGLGLDDVRAVHIPLPPLAEQRRIVAAIEEQFTRLDAGVAALKRAQAALKRYRAAVLKAAVEGRLTAQWRAQHPDVRPASELLADILVERRAKWEADLRAKGKDPAKARYEEPKAPQTEALPELPQGWVWAMLGSIAEIQLGKMLSPKAYEPNLVQMPYLRNENIRWGWIDVDDVKQMGFEPDRLERYSVCQGDLLVCEGGEAGRCAVYTGPSGMYMYQKALHRVRPAVQNVDVHFIQICMQHYVMSKTVIPRPSETTIQHLPLEKMLVLPMPLPSRSEQEQIVSEVEQRLSVVSEVEAAVAASLKRAERLRQAILERAFTGRLVPQDTDDEPASTLLERIGRSPSTGGALAQRSLYDLAEEWALLPKERH